MLETRVFRTNAFKTIVSIPGQLLVLVIRGYQLFISPLLPSSCRYTPTCSQYAILALKKYGAFKGLILATHRLLRCNPWGGHGHDPPRWYSEEIADTSLVEEETGVQEESE